MAKNQKIVFSFDDSGFRPDRTVQPADFSKDVEPIIESTDKGDSIEFSFLNPVTGEKRLLVLPKAMERKFF